MRRFILISVIVFIFIPIIAVVVFFGNIYFNALNIHTDNKGKSTMTYKELIQTDQIIRKSIKSQLSDKILTMSLPACYEDHIDFSFHQKRGLTEQDLHTTCGWIFSEWAFSPITEKSVDCSPEINEIKNGRKGHNGASVSINRLLPLLNEDGTRKNVNIYSYHEELGRYKRFITERNDIRLYETDSEITFYLSELKEKNKKPIEITFGNINNSSYYRLPAATIKTIIYDEFILEYRFFSSNMKKTDNPYSLLENNNPKDSNTVEKMISILKTSKSNEELLNHPELFWELVDNNEKVIRFFENHSVIKEGNKHE